MYNFETVFMIIMLKSKLSVFKHDLIYIEKYDRSI